MREAQAKCSELEARCKSCAADVTKATGDLAAARAEADRLAAVASAASAEHAVAVEALQARLDAANGTPCPPAPQCRCVEACAD